MRERVDLVGTEPRIAQSLDKLKKTQDSELAILELTCSSFALSQTKV